MPVVLLHPIGLDGRCWQWMGLDGAVAYDLPGHGGRPRPATLTMADLADDVVANVSGPLDLVGLSMGGMVALHVALRHPGRVRSLVVACSSARADRELLQRRAEMVERVGMGGVLDETLRRWFTPTALDDPDHPGVRYARERLLADRAEDFAAAWRAMSQHDVLDQLGRVQVPVTAIAGEQDAASPIEALRAIAEGVANGRLVVLPGPHMLQLEEPARLTEAVMAHLAGR
ncbi:MAG TPA: alpha/beta hydrolase [Candidatus Dormibacteraeota bacterium]|nr:alpha/beta hydrolase [Candidatus Dormibacteraeota bacterium]